AFRAVPDDQPTAFVAYTIKGFGLPFAGHKDNHAGLMNPEQMAEFKQRNRIADGAEWEHWAGLDLPAATLAEFVAQVPFANPAPRRASVDRIAVPASLPLTTTPEMPTQEGFGRIMADLAREGGALAERIVTTSPDVTVSTNLGGWVNRRGVFSRH